MLLVAALGADVGGHVLHDAQHRDLDLLEHLEPLAGVEQGDVLGRGDDDGAGDRDLLGQGQLGVAGARGQVDHQIVEVGPVGVVEQLLQGLGDHGAAPDHRGLLVDEEADGHGLEVVAVHRLQGLAVDGLRLAGDAQHARLGGAVDVGVEDADLGPLSGQGQRQVDRGGGLAHAALAGGHGDDVLDVVDGLEGLLHRVGVDLPGHVHGHVGHAGHGGDLLLDARGDGADHALGGEADHHLDLDLPALDLDALDGASADQIALQVRLDVTLDGGFDVFFRGLGHGNSGVCAVPQDLAGRWRWWGGASRRGGRRGKVRDKCWSRAGAKSRAGPLDGGGCGGVPGEARAPCLRRTPGPRPLPDGTRVLTAGKIRPKLLALGPGGVLTAAGRSVYQPLGEPRSA